MAKGKQKQVGKLSPHSKQKIGGRIVNVQVDEAGNLFTINPSSQNRTFLGVDAEKQQLYYGGETPEITDLPPAFRNPPPGAYDPFTDPEGRTTGGPNPGSLSFEERERLINEGAIPEGVEEIGQGLQGLQGMIASAENLTPEEKKAGFDNVMSQIMGRGGTKGGKALNPETGGAPSGNRLFTPEQMEEWNDYPKGTPENQYPEHFPPSGWTFGPKGPGGRLIPTPDNPSAPSNIWPNFPQKPYDPSLPPSRTNPPPGGTPPMPSPGLPPGYGDRETLPEKWRGPGLRPKPFIGGLGLSPGLRPAPMPAPSLGPAPIQESLQEINQELLHDSLSKLGQVRKLFMNAASSVAGSKAAGTLGKVAGKAAGKLFNEEEY